MASQKWGIHSSEIWCPITGQFIPRVSRQSSGLHFKGQNVQELWLKPVHLKSVTQLQFWSTTNLRMAVAEEADDGEEIVLVPVLGSNTAPCGDSPPLCTVSAAEGMDDAVVGVAAAGWRIRPNAAVLSRLLGLSLFDLCNLCTHVQHVYQELCHLCLRKQHEKPGSWTNNIPFIVAGLSWRHIDNEGIKLVFFPCYDSPSQPRPPHCWSFQITLRHATLSRIPPDEWGAAHRRDFYLTPHNTHKRQTSVPPAGFKPRIPANEWPETAQPLGPSRK